MFAGKSIFLYGPPGTAKSLIAKRASMAFNVDESKTKKFFSYLMNRFSTPEEIFGPIDIAMLKKNQLKRNTEGYLPNTYFAFLDEIWKSSPAILNTLLTIINERMYQDGNESIKVPLRGIVCASNEFPKADQGLEALYDRMLLRLCVFPMQKRENFENLLRKKQEEEIKLTNTFSIQELEEIAKESQNVDFSKEALDALHLIKTLLLEKQISEEENQENGEKCIYVSDRRWGQMADLLKTAVYLSGRKEILPSDLLLLKDCLWECLEDKQRVEEILEQALQSFSLVEEHEYLQFEKDFMLFKNDLDKTFYRGDGTFIKDVAPKTKELYLEQCNEMLEEIAEDRKKLNEKKERLMSQNQNLFLPNDKTSIVFSGIEKQISKYTQLQLKIQELQYNIENQKDLKPSKQEKQSPKQEKVEILKDWAVKYAKQLDQQNTSISSVIGDVSSIVSMFNSKKK